MTNTFIVGLKTAIIVDKYTYPITDAAFKPPILYKPLAVKGSVPPPQAYDFLYQLPADIGPSGSRFTLFFGKNPPPPAPPRSLDANGEPILTADEQDHMNDHHVLVSADHAAAANTAVAGINAANPLILPPVPSIPAAAPVAPAAAPTTAGVAAPTTAGVAAPAPVAAPTTSGVAAPAPAPVAAGVSPAPGAQGGRRTRRTSLPKTRKHRKGNKGRRVSRRKHRKSHARRH